MPLQIGDGLEWPDVDIDIEKANQNVMKIYRNNGDYKTLTLNLKKKIKKGYDKHICSPRYL